MAKSTSSLDNSNEGGRLFILLIDGPSGSGKSTLARVLREKYQIKEAGSTRSTEPTANPSSSPEQNCPTVLATNPALGTAPDRRLLSLPAVQACRGAQSDSVTLIKLDDMYPGWEGLQAASESLVADILAPLRAGRDGTWTRWDWVASRPAETHTVPPHGFLIIEGCGAVTGESVPLADCCVWLGADNSIRKQRALARGGENFDTHWARWQRQFDTHVAHNHPDMLADFCADSTRNLPVSAVLSHLARFHGIPD